MLIGTPPLILTSIPSLKKQNWGSVLLQGWLSLTYSFFFAVAIGYVIWYTGVSRIGGARTALYENLITVVAIAVAWILLYKRMTPLQVVDAAMVLFSLYLAGRTSKG
jgi:drug/metabolite transporter (DMT)-like permease